MAAHGAIRLRESLLLRLIACMGLLALAGCATQASYVYQRPTHQTRIALVLAEGYPFTSFGHTGIVPAMPCRQADLEKVPWTAVIWITRAGEKPYRPIFGDYYDAGNLFYKDFQDALIRSGEKHGLQMKDISPAVFEDGFHGKTLKNLLDKTGSGTELDAIWVFVYNIRNGVTEERIIEQSYYSKKILTTTYEGLTATMYPLFIDNSGARPVSLPPKSISVKRQQGQQMEDVEDKVLDELVGLFEGFVA